MLKSLIEVEKVTSVKDRLSEEAIQAVRLSLQCMPTAQPYQPTGQQQPGHGHKPEYHKHTYARQLLYHGVYCQDQ